MPMTSGLAWLRQRLSGARDRATAVRERLERTLFWQVWDRLLEIEREKGASLKIADIHEEVAGVYPKVMIDGEMDAGAWSCGMVAGLIKDVPTVKELIDRIMADAERLIRDRLTGFLDGDSKAALKVA